MNDKILKFPRVGEFAKADDYNYINAGKIIDVEFEDNKRIYAYIDQIPYVADKILQKCNCDVCHLTGFQFNSNYAKLVSGKMTPLRTACIFVGVEDKDDDNFRFAMKLLKEEMIKDTYNFEATCKGVLNDKYMLALDIEKVLAPFYEW